MDDRTIAMVCMVLLNSCSYNKMVEKDEAVSTAWSNVETQYQRRADLIPNLVSTVKGYATHESSTLEAVVAARSKATQITVDPANLTAEKLAEYQKAQGAVSSALGKTAGRTVKIPQQFRKPVQRKGCGPAKPTIMYAQAMRICLYGIYLPKRSSDYTNSTSCSCVIRRYATKRTSEERPRNTVAFHEPAYKKKPKTCCPY